MNAARSPLLLGLTGSPLGHSLSPRLHTAALAACGLAGEYALFPVPPLPEGAADLAVLIGRVRSGELRGLNVTIPHKRSVLPLLDALTPAAEAIGAVNTIYMEGNRLTGENTDAAGFWMDVKRCFDLAPAPGLVPPVDRSVPGERWLALLLGAGGGARAAAWALLQAGWEVRVSARQAGQAAALLREIGGDAEQVLAWPLEPAALDGWTPDLIVNATPLGMSPHSDASPWPERVPFPAGACIYDLVYNPRETLFVRRARAAGLRAETGLGMLVEQAARAFEIWTGCPPPRGALWTAVDP